MFTPYFNINCDNGWFDDKNFNDYFVLSNRAHQYDNHSDNFFKEHYKDLFNNVSSDYSNNYYDCSHD